MIESIGVGIEVLDPVEEIVGKRDVQGAGRHPVKILVTVQISAN